MPVTAIPPALRERLEAMTDAELAAERKSIVDARAFHEPHVATSLRATRAVEALDASLSFVDAVAEERS